MARKFLLLAGLGVLAFVVSQFQSQPAMGDFDDDDFGGYCGHGGYCGGYGGYCGGYGGYCGGYGGYRGPVCHTGYYGGSGYGGCSSSCGYGYSPGPYSGYGPATYQYQPTRSWNACGTTCAAPAVNCCTPAPTCSSPAPRTVPASYSGGSGYRAMPAYWNVPPF